MAFQFDDLVGTGETYTTPAAWMTARYLNEAWTGDRRMRLKAEQFSALNRVVYFTNEGDTGTTYWTHITAEDGAEHNGTFNAKSSIGNARFRVTNAGSAFNGVIENRDGYDRILVSWLELSNLDEGGAIVMNPSCNDITIHHCLLNAVGANINHVAIWGITSNGKFYRNCVVGTNLLTDDDGLSSIANTKVLHNTFSGGDSCTGGGTLDEMARNFAFGSTGANYASGQNQGENASEDGTGDDSFDNLTPSDQIEGATQLETTFDPNVKKTGDIFEGSTTTYSTTTYPEIDVPINDRNGFVPATWSIGAADVTSPQDDHEIQRGIFRGIERGVQ